MSTGDRDTNSGPKILKIDGQNVPDDIPFDPEALRKKYVEERDKRLRHNTQGVEQYRMIDDSSRLIVDPYISDVVKRSPITEDVEAVVIGGGYGGQLVSVRLIQAGVKNIRIIEKGGDFGGTWYWNRYPGAQCDIESYIYMPLLDETGYVPTEKYARAKELLQHAKMIGLRFGLYPKTLFQTEVKSVVWNESNTRWNVKTNRGDNISARFVIPAAGPLHRPKLPGTPGLESFRGHSFHSSRWDYEYTGGDSNGGMKKLVNMRVGIIGTGATAVQIVPHLGEWAKQLYVFQRTPSSIDIRGNKTTDSEWVKRLGDGWQKKRMDNFNIIVNGGHQDIDLVADGWTDIFSRLIVRPKEGESVSPSELDTRRQLADFVKMQSIRARVDKIVKDPATAESLKPYYNQLCKRPCFHDEYLDTFNRPNVELVDTNGKGIDRFTENGIIANGKEYELDCLIFATGFELATDWTHRAGMEIYGRNGLTITEKWKYGASTLHGWTTRGFPNCLFVSIVQASLTPNFIHVTGEQANHIAYVISECKKRGIKTIEPTEESEKAWVDVIVASGELRRSFNQECTPGYYNNEGKPSLATARNGGYYNPLEFLNILSDWRAAGKLSGLEVTKFEGGLEKSRI